MVKINPLFTPSRTYRGWGKPDHRHHSNTAHPNNTLELLSPPRVRADAPALAHCTGHCFHSFPDFTLKGRLNPVYFRTSTGCLPIFRSLTLTFPWERSALMSVQIQQEYPVAGGRQRHWQVSCWEPPSPGAGTGAPLSECPPHPPWPLRAHRMLKGAAAAFTQRSAGPGCYLRLKGFPKQEVNDGTTWEVDLWFGSITGNVT